VIAIRNECNCCFHVVATGTNKNIENAKTVRSKAILYRSTEDDPPLYDAAYDSSTRTVFFCLCDPDFCT
jgi:hypothetical protein